MMGEKRRCIHGRTEKQRCAECNEMDALNERNHTLYTKLEAAEARVRELEANWGDHEPYNVLALLDLYHDRELEAMARAEKAEAALGEARDVLTWYANPVRSGSCVRANVWLAANGEGELDARINDLKCELADSIQTEMDLDEARKALGEARELLVDGTGDDEWLEQCEDWLDNHTPPGMDKT